MRPSGLVACVLLVLGTLVPNESASQESPPDIEPESVHWAFASVFGTGWYRLEDNRSVWVLRMPPRWTTREAGFDEEGKRQVGVEWHLPITVGFHQVDEVGDFFEAENYSTLSVTPGIELEIPVSRNFSLRPFVKVGYGAQLGSDDDEDAWIWNTGLKSRYQLPMARDWSLLANVYWAGFDELNGDDSDDIAGWMLGAEHAHELGETSFTGNWHFSYTWLSPALDYVKTDRDTVENDLDGYFTIGFAVSPWNGPWDFWLYRPHQLGLAIEFDPEGDYVAIKYNSRSWFTQ